MVVLPLSRFQNDKDPNTGGQPTSDQDMGGRPEPTQTGHSINWLRFASAATLIASGALLFGGKRRAGLFIATTGTALALLDQQELMRKWWAMLPYYIDDIQMLLNQAEGAVEEFAAQREKIGQVIGR